MNLCLKTWDGSPTLVIIIMDGTNIIGNTLMQQQYLSLLSSLLLFQLPAIAIIKPLVLLALLPYLLSLFRRTFLFNILLKN